MSRTWHEPFRLLRPATDPILSTFHREISTRGIPHIPSFSLSLSLFLQMQRLKSALNLSNDLTGSKLQEQRSSLTKDFIALDKFRYVTSIRIGG